MKQGNHWSCFILSSHLDKRVWTFWNYSQKDAESCYEKWNKIDSKEDSPSDIFFDSWQDQYDSQAECKHYTHYDKQSGENTEDSFCSKLFRGQLINVCRDQSHKQTDHNTLQGSAYENGVYALNLDDSFDHKWKDAENKGEFP